uniref:AP 3 complex subunit mu 1 n=1 Tax=Echinococcus granulosus TaxID=6210 RepID=A0A068WE48_ECHGR|nr:AP 3 complex subunit mu 1 [Echinococcus granulosus]
MIRSVFIINKDRQVLLEKHWKTITPRSVLDSICEGQSQLLDPLKVPTAVEAPNNVILIIVEKNGIFLIATCNEEAPPLLIVEFLNQVVLVFEDYFGNIGESVIVDNIVCASELLDEMLDNGFPLTTEPNILRELIKPPKLLRSIAEVVIGRPVGGVTSTLPANQLTKLRWRRAGVKYTTNEAFFDVTECVNAIIDRSGNILLAEVEGAIDCTIHLSGTPDLTLSFNNPRLLDDVGLHPCVRYFRWEKQRILSFIPPDGKFRLFTYFIPNLSSISLPIALRHNISLKAVGSRFELSVSPKSTAGRPLEKVKVSVVMPSEVSSVNVTPSLGKSSFDTVTKILTWDVGHLETQTYPSLKGSVTLHSGYTQVSTAPVVNLQFEFPQCLVSGLRVTRLEMHAENYKPYKGVRYVTVAGKFEVRV